LKISTLSHKGIALLAACCFLNVPSAALARDTRLISPPVAGASDPLTIRKAFQLEKDPTVSLVLRNQPVEFILRGLAQKANLNLIFMVEGAPTGMAGAGGSSDAADDPLAALEREVSGQSAGGGGSGGAGSGGQSAGSDLQLIIPYLELKDVPVSEAFSVIMQLSGLTGRRIYNSILITTPARMEKMGFSTPIIKTYTLYNQFPAMVINANANLGTAPMPPIIPPAPAAVAGPLGVPVPPIPIAQQLSAVFTSRGISPEPRMMLDQRTSTLILIGSQEAIDIADMMIPILDRPLPQVVVEIKLIELTQRASQELGVSYGFGQEKMGASFNNFNAATLGPGNPISGDGEAVISFNSLSRFAPNFSARLNALIRDSQARVLTNPRLTIQHGVTASFNSTTQFPILSTTSTTTTTTQTVQSLDIGETLEITPFIDVEEGIITMQLKPNISTRGEVISVGGAQAVPERNTRSLATVLSVPDGDSVIIGGLMRKSDTETRSRIPFLGDIPLLGALFSSTDKSQEDVEVVIMVTPRILQSR